VRFSDILSSLSSRPSDFVWLSPPFVATVWRDFCGALGGSLFGVSSMRPRESTSGYVKLLLPPRQSRGNSHVGLAPRLKAEIVREIRRLEVLLEMISTVEAERDAILTEKKSTHLNADKIKMLAKLKAIGAEFSTTLVGEVFYREFANRRQLGSYVGLASSPFCSGSLDRDQGISKAGNPKARVMMIVLGPGCAINLRARSAAGFGNASETSKVARVGLRSLPWRASSWWLCGAICKPASSQLAQS
jgi:transposase